MPGFFRAGGLPGAGWRAVAADDLPAGAADLAGAVRVHGQRPAPAGAALDGFALLVTSRIEGRRPAAGTAVLLLVVLDRDNGLDPALAQVRAVGRRGVRLVSHRPARTSAGSRPLSRS